MNKKSHRILSIRIPHSAFRNRQGYGAPISVNGAQ
jgi:hypothetical protein